MAKRYQGFSPTQLQAFLNYRLALHKPLTVDGVEGTSTSNAVALYLDTAMRCVDAFPGKVFSIILKEAAYPRRRIAVFQDMLFNENLYKGKIDGFWGPNTAYSAELWQNELREFDGPMGVPVPAIQTVWPTYSELTSFYGKVGTGHTVMELPYPMRIAWDTSSLVNRITVHEKCSDSLRRILVRMLEQYGYDTIKRERMDLFGGCFNDRNMRGSDKKSTHAWACAIDLDPERNQLRMSAKEAQFAQPRYKPMLDAFAAEGWVSLGVARNYDWMHFQASRL